MRRFAKVSFVLFAAALIGLGSAQAQDDDYYEDEGYGGARENKFAVGLGVGIIDTDGGNDVYFAGSLRIKLGGKGEGQVEEGIVGYLEPEIGYWSADETDNDLRVQATDFHIGIGITGVIPTRAADIYMNVGLDVHNFDVTIDSVGDVTTGVPLFDESDTSFGGHAKVGLDLYLGDNFSLFGEGGFYLIDTDFQILENQVKVYLGGRVGF